MDAQQVLDSAAGLSFKWKAVIAAACLLAIAAVIGGAFYWGVRSGQGWAESKYMKERDANLARAIQAENNAKQLEAENALFRKQNEAQALILSANDAKIAGDAKKFDELLQARNKRFDDIDVDGDYQNQLKGVCDDMKASGFALSPQFCDQGVPK